MNRRMSALYLLLCCMTAMTGCALYEKATEEPILTPSAKVLSVTLADQTDQGARLIVLVELTNPNAHIALPLRFAQYQVSAGGASAGSTSKPARTLPAGGTQTVELPVSIAGVTALSGAAVQAGGSITYEPPGEVRMLLTESSVPLPTVTFSYSGTIQ
jgi:LEA14-like dessication related protein